MSDVRTWRPRKNKKCWCGSGKSERDCHGRGKTAGGDAHPRHDGGAEIGPERPATSQQAIPKPWGVPGEEHRLFVAPQFKDRPANHKDDLRGLPGRYRVEFLLARPGYPITMEREHKFIDQIVGSSHFRIAKPKSERTHGDTERISARVFGKPYAVMGEANGEGFLGKLVCELEADNRQSAEIEAYGAVAPLLSAWSMNADIPVHVETVQVTDLKTQIRSLKVTTPHFEMDFPRGPQPAFSDEFCQYASIYRDALNSNSGFYRFLCFYKILESLIARRGRESSAKRAAGQDPRREYETIPGTNEGQLALLNRLYPWRPAWDQMAISQIFPGEVHGQRVTAIRDRHLRPLRVGIAHALFDQGEITVILDKIEYVQDVNKWLPLCRLLARWMLLTDFPRECSLGLR
jgi:hypothetical protein